MKFKPFVDHPHTCGFINRLQDKTTDALRALYNSDYSDLEKFALSKELFVRYGEELRAINTELRDVADDQIAFMYNYMTRTDN